MKKVLILEDNLILWDIYNKKLLREGFDVIWTKTVDQSVSVLENFMADIVIIDYWIKWDDKNWIDLIKHVKILSPKAYIIMITNYNISEVHPKALSAWVDELFVKINATPKVLSEYLKNLKL